MKSKDSFLMLITKMNDKQIEDSISYLRDIAYELNICADDFFDYTGFTKSDDEEDHSIDQYEECLEFRQAEAMNRFMMKVF